MSSVSDDALSVGILLDGPVMRRWAVEAVEAAIDRATVSVDQVILKADGDAGRSRLRR